MHKAFQPNIWDVLGEAEVHALAAVGVEMATRAGEIVTARGTPGDSVLLVRSGRLVAAVPGRDHRPLILGTLGPGAVIGEIAAIDGAPRLRTVLAQIPSRLLQVPTPDFRRTIAAHPELQEALLDSLARQVRAMTDRYQELAVYDLETRVRLMLVRLLRQAGALHDGGRLDPAPSHQDLAAQVGTNREAVSRALGAMAKRGLIETGRRLIHVRDAYTLSRRP